MLKLKDGEKKCCVCGVQKEKADENRSFHKLPKNEELKEKWFDAIGRRVTQKDARVCSDHFRKEDFPIRVDGQETVVLRRLVRNAVPFMKGSNSLLSTNTSLPETSATVLEYFIEPHVVINISNANKDENFSGKLTYDINMEKDPLAISDVDIKQENINKRTPEELCNAPVRKRYRTNGFLEEILCRADFVSESGWKLYRQYVERSRKQIKMLQQKNLRYENKVKHLKTLIK